MKATAADEKILACLNEGRSFLLDAGAGSGKTTSLIRALNEIRGARRRELIANSQHVACITFTNVAKNEIIERTERDPLFKVTTIHDFLWEAIKGFQPELRVAVAAVNEQLPSKSKRKKDPLELAEALKKVDISYSDRGSNFLEGRIFHDDLLDIAHFLFGKHPLLSKITASRFPFIFVDEYQDTDASVVNTLLDHILTSGAPPMLGFFGDKMQSIYPDGVGELSDQHRGMLRQIQKEENYRCSIAVINLLNRIRSDIKQVPAGNNHPGSAVYLNIQGASSDQLIDVAKALVRDKFAWKFEESDLRVLFLTHRLIARKAGYENLFGAYNQRGGFWQDQFQAGKDPIASFLCENVDFLLISWSNGDVGSVISLLNKNRQVVASKEGKARVKSSIDALLEISASGGTIEAMLRKIREDRLLPLLDRINEALDKNYGDIDDPNVVKEREFFEALLAVPFKEVTAYNAVLERNLPYSTKHGVKGDEFDTVFVVLDDAGANWSQYSFGNLLAGADKSEDRLRRSRNLFYVSCSRAKRNLAVVDLGNGGASKDKIVSLFGLENCVF